MDFGLEDRVVLVTGGSRGIGKAIARAALAEGATVVICGRNDDVGRGVVSQFGQEKCSWRSCDVSDDREIEQLLEHVLDRHGRIDAVVNNAGRFGGGPASELRAEGLHEGIDTKVLGTLQLVRAALPALRESDQARVINISGITAQRVIPGAAVTKVTLGVASRTKSTAFRPSQSSIFFYACVRPGVQSIGQGASFKVILK